MRVPTIACTDLKDLTLNCPIPKGLVSAIAKNCPCLTKCDFTEKVNVDNDDIRQLSESCPDLRQILLQSAESITTGIEYLPALRQLEDLELYYHSAKSLDKTLLLKFVDLCPNLKQLTVSDWASLRDRLNRPRHFKDTPLEELFPAAAALPTYFEPKFTCNNRWTPDALDSYTVRIDRLREDMFQFRQLTERLGGTLVRRLFSKC